MWKYESPIGTLIIRKTDDGYGFEYDGVIWEACDTPQAEADNIAQHVTNCDKWDSCEYDAPSDLSQWEVV